ncbi:addiction module antidote protein [Xanthobacter autotrophicus]|uniref:addiction module antidote protein n=1 Tax=Xanthobacter autotrophicus TaxID=280 RepID=UPI003728A677
MATKTTKFDAADYIDTTEDVIANIEAAFEDGDPTVITMTLGDIARSKGMTAVAKEAGVTREALYKALSADGDPKLSTLLGVMKALGLQLTVVRGRAA